MSKKRLNKIVENLAALSFMSTFGILFLAMLMPWDVIAAPLYISMVIFMLIAIALGALNEK